MPMDASNKFNHKLLIMVGALAIVLGGVLSLLNYQKYDKANKELVSQKKELASLIVEIEETRRKLAQYDQEKTEFAKVMFSERDVPAFLDSISQFAAQDNVQIVNMKTQNFQQVIVPKEISENMMGYRLNSNREANDAAIRQQNIERIMTLSAMPIQIRIKGEFESLLSFFSQLESYKQLLSISRMKINSQQDYPILDCDFTVKIYSLMNLKDLSQR